MLPDLTRKWLERHWVQWETLEEETNKHPGGLFEAEHPPTEFLTDLEQRSHFWVVLFCLTQLEIVLVRSNSR